MLGALAVNVVTTIPQLLVVGVGLVLSLVFRRRLGNRSTFTLLGFVAMLLAALLVVIGSLISVFMPSIVADQHMSAGQVSAYFGVVALVRTVVEVAAWVLLLVGIFRRPQGSSPAENPPFGTPAGPVSGVQPGFGGQPSPAAQPGFAGQPGFPAAPGSAPGQPASAQPGVAGQPTSGQPAPGTPGAPAQPGETSPYGQNPPFGGPSPY